MSEAVGQIRVVEGLRGPAGQRLEALLNTGVSGAGFGAEMAAVVCHPHPAGGGTMHNKVVYHAMKALAGLGMPVLRFNFRGVGLSEGEHDDGHGEQQDVLAAVDWMRNEFPGRSLLVAGFSFGAAVAMRACCGDARVAGLIGLGLPVSAAGREYRYPFLAECRTPKLLCSGDRDPYAPRELLDEVFWSAAEPKRVVWVAEAEHFFQGTASSPGPKLGEMQAAVRGWVEDTFGPGVQVPGRL